MKGGFYAVIKENLRFRLLKRNLPYDTILKV